MDELVKLVSQKTGLSEDQSRRAVEVVIGHLKKNLPAPVAGQIDGLLSGAEAASDLGSLVQGLGGMLGQK